MSAKKTGLGMNNHLGNRLAALGLNEINEERDRHGGAAAEIDIDAIAANPSQPRRDFGDDGLQALADSIRQYGIIQPLVVRRNGDAYELIAGERRLRAAKMCGLRTVPAVVRDCDELQVSAEIALIENVQREDLDPVEEASAYETLIRHFGLTQEQVAAKVGKSRSHVANMTRLLQLPEEIQQYLIDGVLSVGQARPLLQLKDKELQLDAAAHVIDRELSARQTEDMVRHLVSSHTAQTPPKPQPEPDAYLESMQDRMKMHLGTNVAIRLGRGKKKGKIEITFTSEEEFERLLALLTDEPEDWGTTADHQAFTI